MTEVAVPQNPAGALAAPAFGSTMVPPTQNTVDLIAWSQELKAAHYIGGELCKTEFVSPGFRGKPESTAAAIMFGKSLGMDPMNALSDLFVVQGRPAMYARTMVALVLSAGHDVRRTAATPDSVTVMARRKGHTEWSEFTWTIDRARQAGYLSNKKYSTDPIAMLTAKAQAEACRTIAPDVLTGVAAYSVEEVELEDMGEAPAPVAAAAAAPKVRAKVAVKRRQAPAPELPAVVHNAPVETADPEPETDGGPEMMTPEQWTHLSAALMGAGHKTKAAMGTAIEEQLNRVTGGPDDITAEEADALIEFFNNSAGAPAALDPAAQADAEWLAGGAA